ncbi:MAG: signal peptidase II [Opitutia bacterium]
MSGLRPYLTFWSVALAALAADVGSKLLVVRSIPFGSYFPGDPERAPVELLSWLWFVHVGNKGAAWGLGSQQDVRPYLVLLALIVLFLVWRWRRQLLVELPGGQLAFGLFVGGTVGNVRDRVLGDHVIDFIDVHLPGYRFPAFNVADACICVGVGLYVILSYRHETARREAIQSHSGDDLAGRR